jgi:hypothetical protein
LAVTSKQEIRLLSAGWEESAFADHAPGATSVQFPAERALWHACSACARVSPFTLAVKAAFLPCATRTTSA